MNINNDKQYLYKGTNITSLSTASDVSNVKVEKTGCPSAFYLKELYEKTVEWPTEEQRKSDAKLSGKHTLIFYVFDSELDRTEIIRY